MRILVVMENVQDKSAFSGGRYHAWLVCKALMDLGHKVCVMTGRVPGYVKELPGDRRGLKILYRKPKLSAENCKVVAGDGKFDLVIGFPIRALPWSYKLARFLNCPHFAWVFDPYAMISLYAPAIANRMAFDEAYLTALKGSKVIVASTAVSRQYIRGFAGDHLDVRVLYPCVNTAVADRVKPLPKDGRKRIVTITRTTSHKRPEHIFRAVHDLHRSQVAVHLHILSGFNPGRLTRLVRKYGIAGISTIEAKCSEERKWQLLKGADLVIGSSIYEGFGLWLMEAIYACTPFVVYEFPIFKEIARGAGGWFAKYDKPQDFSNMLAHAALADTRPQVQHLTAIAPMYGFQAFKNRVEELVKDV